MIVRRSNRFYSNRQEKKVAKAVSGRQVANSGATAFDFVITLCYYSSATTFNNNRR